VKKWSNAVRWALTVFDARRSTVFMWVLWSRMVMGVGERVAVEAAGPQPREEGPDPGVVGAAGVAVRRGPLQSCGVGGVDRGERLGYRLVLPPYIALAISEVDLPG
jgi:hypothetical protein